MSSDPLSTGSTQGGPIRVMSDDMKKELIKRAEKNVSVQQGLPGLVQPVKENIQIVNAQQQSWLIITNEDTIECCDMDIHITITSADIKRFLCDLYLFYLAYTLGRVNNSKQLIMSFKPNDKDERYLFYNKIALDKKGVTISNDTATYGSSAYPGGNDDIRRHFLIDPSKIFSNIAKPTELANITFKNCDIQNIIDILTKDDKKPERDTLSYIFTEIASLWSETNFKDTDNDVIKKYVDLFNKSNGFLQKINDIYTESKKSAKTSFGSKKRSKRSRSISKNNKKNNKITHKRSKKLSRKMQKTLKDIIGKLHF
jgi:hypothetical protein